MTRAGFTTNNVENLFGVFKPGRTYTLCGEQHLERYLTALKFHHYNRSGLVSATGEWTAKALKCISGKRLTYRPTYEGRSQEAERETFFGLTKAV